MPVRIRKTTDIETIRELDAKLIGPDAATPVLEDHVWWLAYVDGRVAGYAGLRVCKTEGGYGFLARAGVLREHRGQGLQRRLIRVRDREARRLGLRRSITYTSQRNYASANNLISCGYRLYDPQYRFGVKDAMYFIKEHQQ